MPRRRRPHSKRNNGFPGTGPADVEQDPNPAQSTEHSPAAGQEQLPLYNAARLNLHAPHALWEPTRAHSISCHWRQEAAEELFLFT